MHIPFFVYLGELCPLLHGFPVLYLVSPASAAAILDLFIIFST